MDGDVFIDVDCDTLYFEPMSEPTDTDKLDLIRQELASHIRYEWRFRKHKNSRFVQKQFAHEVGLLQPEISDILRGRLERFSVDRLMLVLIRCGLRPYIDCGGTWFERGGVVPNRSQAAQRPAHSPSREDDIQRD